MCLHILFVWVASDDDLRLVAALGNNITQGGHTALMRAAEKGQTDCVRMLLQAGANKNAQAAVRAFVQYLKLVFRCIFRNSKTKLSPS